MTVSFFWRKLYINFTHLLHKSLRAISLQTTDNGVVTPTVDIIVKSYRVLHQTGCTCITPDNN